MKDKERLTSVTTENLSVSTINDEDAEYDTQLIEDLDASKDPKVSQDSEASYTPNASQILITSQDETLLWDSQKNRINLLKPSGKEQISKKNDFNTQLLTLQGLLIEHSESQIENDLSKLNMSAMPSNNSYVQQSTVSKIILRKPETYQTRDIDAAAADCLKYLELKIDVVLLDKFKQTKRRNYEWEGNTEDKSLYNVWHQIASDVEGLPKLVSEDAALENDLQTPPVSFLDASILTDILSVDKPKEVPATSNDSNTALATTSRPDRVEQVTRNICFVQKTICSKVFYNVLPYPKEINTDSKKKRKKEYTPNVITSDKWVEYHEECEKLKMEKEREKQERKQAREMSDKLDWELFTRNINAENFKVEEKRKLLCMQLNIEKCDPTKLSMYTRVDLNVKSELEFCSNRLLDLTGHVRLFEKKPVTLEY
ncbi:hypothetical protein RN001_000197 [Aquatica leii]|uniref:Uncharacterized protein n=1 Tax=Aquatica leii TaxID=1421715 RepID=A0AAN7PLZ1_9COLE|nr:hypothetical protein RN001_000197 [Aquatica leii]